MARIRSSVLWFVPHQHSSQSLPVVFLLPHQSRPAGFCGFFFFCYSEEAQAWESRSGAVCGSRQQLQQQQQQAVQGRGQGGVNGDGQARVGWTEMVESLTVKLGPQVNTQCAFLWSRTCNVRISGWKGSATWTTPMSTNLLLALSESCAIVLFAGSYRSSLCVSLVSCKQYCATLMFQLVSCSVTRFTALNCDFWGRRNAPLSCVAQRQQFGFAKTPEWNFLFLHVLECQVDAQFYSNCEDYVHGTYLGSGPYSVKKKYVCVTVCACTCRRSAGVSIHISLQQKHWCDSSRAARFHRSLY